jgi:pyruvate/2-oxoglutarate dehydrogenase complex dihydrolipoamide acyltransferase (E2) component
MMSDKRIRLARSVRWRRIRSRMIPMATFGLASLATFWLLQQRGGTVQSIGEVASPKVNVTSPATGLVVTMANRTNRNWSAWDRIEIGDVIARIEVDAVSVGSESTKKTVDVVAPISGTLVDVTCWPGQTVVPGQLIATIASHDAGHVVSFVPEGTRAQVRPGMKVTLRGRTAGSPRIESEIEQVGGSIEQVPRHQRATATMPEWGAPVRIKVPNDQTLQPGALVDVLIHKAAPQ